MLALDYVCHNFFGLQIVLVTKCFGRSMDRKVHGMQNKHITLWLRGSSNNSLLWVWHSSHSPPVYLTCSSHTMRLTFCFCGPQWAKIFQHAMCKTILACWIVHIWIMELQNCEKQTIHLQWYNAILYSNICLKSEECQSYVCMKLWRMSAIFSRMSDVIDNNVTDTGTKRMDWVSNIPVFASNTVQCDNLFASCTVSFIMLYLPLVQIPVQISHVACFWSP